MSMNGERVEKGLPKLIAFLSSLGFSSLSGLYFEYGCVRGKSSQLLSPCYVLWHVL